MRDTVDLIFLAPGLGTGGTERHLAWLLPALKQQGLRVEVWNAGTAGAAEERLLQAGVQVRHRKPPVSARHLGRLASMTTALARRRPRLVHSYLYGHHWLDAVACRMAGVTYIGSRRNLAHWREGPVLARERWRDRASSVIVANSRAAAEVAVAEGVEPRLVQVIPNGVPMPAWAEKAWTADDAWLTRRRDARDALGLDGQARVVGAVMSLKTIKDPALLISAFARIKGTSSADHLVLVGEGPLAAELKQQAVDLGLAGRVIFAGQRAEPQELLAAFDLFCLPSRSEGCSNAVLEAMAAALPVVATDCGGNTEAVDSQVSGLLVPTGEVEPLARALTRLLEHPEEARTMGQAGRRRAEAMFSLDAMVKAHLKVYSGQLPAGHLRVA
jgi:glycosyltransferase involved in cell wall biosynthesis